MQTASKRIWAVKNYPRYKRYDLGRQPVGTTVEVVLSCINNVRLLDHENYLRYIESKPYKCYGGRIDKSPTRFTIPNTGRWHVVVDKIGFQTLANSNVRAILPKGIASMNGAGFTNVSASGAVAGEEISEQQRALDSEARGVKQILNELDTYKQIANTDVLTGLNNRRSFDNIMAEIFNNPEAHDTSALILSDIDHFKSFNDTYGHAIGDSVLRIVADTIRKVLPKNATPARIGGEEFAIVVENVTAQDAMEIAEIARKAVENQSFVDEASGTDCGQVTISLGICLAREAENIASLYQKSDLALYASKKTGRNKCTLFHAGLEQQQKTVEPDELANPKDRRSGSRNPQRKPIELRM